MEKLNTPWFYLCTAPIVCGVFDYLENINAIIMLNLYPYIPAWMAAGGSIFTVTKLVFGIGYFLIILVLLAVIGYGWLKAKTVKSQSPH